MLKELPQCDTATGSEQMLLENDSDRRLMQICHKPSIWLKKKTKKVQYLWSVTEWGSLIPELLSPCFWSLHFQKKSLANSRVVQHLRVFTAEDTDSTKVPQFSSVTQTLCDTTDRSTQASPSITSSRSLLRPMSIEPLMPSTHLTLCCLLLLLPSNPSQHQGLFQWVSSSH